MDFARRLTLAVRRRETPLARLAYDTYRRLQRTEVPAVPMVYRPLYTLWKARQASGEVVGRTLYYQPMFRALCASVGRSLFLYGGMPYVYGGLQIHIGDNCKLSAKTSLVAGKVYDNPTLVVGNNTNIGWGVNISVCERVTIGNHVRVANCALIADNPGHPMDAIARRTEPVTPDQVRPIVIEDDVWIGTGAMVFGGVTIGRGSVVAAGSTVTRDVPPGVVVAGSPARVVRVLDSEASHDAA